MSWVFPLRFKHFYGIEIQPDAIRMTALSKHPSEWRVHEVEEAAFASVGALAGIDSFLASQSGRLREAAVSFPLSSLWITHLTVPDLPPEDQFGAVRYETARMLHRSVDELMTDYTVYEPKNDRGRGFHKVTSFAYLKSEIHPVLMIFQKHGISVPVVDVPPMAYLNTLLMLEPWLRDRSFLGLCVCQSFLLILAIEKSRLVFVRKVSQPVELGSQGEKASGPGEIFIDEIQKTLQYIHTHITTFDPDRIVLCEVGRDENMLQDLQQVLGIESRRFDVLDRLHLQESTEAERLKSSSLAVAAGLAIRMTLEPS